MKRNTSDKQLTLFPKAQAQRTDERPSVVAEDSPRAKATPRRLKIQQGEYNGSRKRHPVIRLAGFWLKGFGFEIGNIVELTGTDGVLTIKRVNRPGE